MEGRERERLSRWDWDSSIRDGKGGEWNGGNDGGGRVGKGEEISIHGLKLVAPAMSGPVVGVQSVRLVLFAGSDSCGEFLGHDDDDDAQQDDDDHGEQQETLEALDVAMQYVLGVLESSHLLTHAHTHAHRHHGHYFHNAIGPVASEAICKWGHNAGAKRRF